MPDTSVSSGRGYGAIGGYPPFIFLQMCFLILSLVRLAIQERHPGVLEDAFASLIRHSSLKFVSTRKV